MILEFSMKLPSASDKLRQVILDYENLPMFLPDQLKKIKILEQNEMEVITEETFLFSTVLTSTSKSAIFAFFLQLNKLSAYCTVLVPNFLLPVAASWTNASL